MVDLVLPVLNEAAALPSVLSSVPTGYRAIVVDNGSDDGSADIARTLGADVVLESRRGFGAACDAGLHRATSDVVCFMDCDGSLRAGDLPRVCGPVLDGEADLVLGSRRCRPGAMPVHARLGNAVLARIVRQRIGAPLSDIGPMRAARREMLIELDLRDRRFGWPLEMVLRAGEAGWRIVELPVPYRPRVGRSKVTGTLRGTARTVRDMTAVLRS
jgi:glycosyltransferase involved in cell wall biosynthesis